MTFKEEIESRELDELRDIANHGCANACPGGYIYYHETSKAYDKHADEIWDYACSLADDLGHKSVLEMFASFQKAESIDSDYKFKNALVWFYIEQIAFHFINSLTKR